MGGDRRSVGRTQQIEEDNRILRNRVAELTDFIENASIPLHWVNAEGIIVWANQAELDALGYTTQEYIGAPIQDFHADTKTIADILTRLMNNETLHNYPAKLRCKDGTIKHVLISSNVLMKEGKFIHTRCFTKDVTEIVQQEKKKNDLLLLLERSEERLRLAINATKLGIWDWKFDEGHIHLSYRKSLNIMDRRFMSKVKKQEVPYSSFLWMNLREIPSFHNRLSRIISCILNTGVSFMLILNVIGQLF